jgi:hypothetical protein
MIARASYRIRAVVALALFATSGGGAQLVDALLFHSRPERPDAVRVNAGDHCHAERCELGAPIVSPPPPALAMDAGRLEPLSHRTIALVPADAPRNAVVAGPLGSRAPPVRS